MRFLDFFRRKQQQQQQQPIAETTLEAYRKKLQYVKEFQCSCTDSNGHNTTIKIRSAKPRDEGPSNFQGVFTPELCKTLGVPLRYVGHSIVPSGELNWKGLLEERNWSVDPVKCPACKLGISVEAYRSARRAGVIL